MVRIAVIARPADVVATVRCLRAHVELPVAELRACVTDGRPVAAFSFADPVADVRRCRALLKAVAGVGAQVRVYASAPGFGEREETLEYLHNWLRNLIGINRATREQMFREAEAEAEAGAGAEAGDASEE